MVHEQRGGLLGIMGIKAMLGGNVGWGCGIIGDVMRKWCNIISQTWTFWSFNLLNFTTLVLLYKIGHRYSKNKIHKHVSVITFKSMVYMRKS